MKIAILSKATHISKINGFSTFVQNLVQEYPDIHWHLLLDTEPDNFKELFPWENISFIANSTQYKETSKESAFKQFCPIDCSGTGIMKFQNVLMEALTKNIYDFVFIHKLDAFMAIFNLGLLDVLPVVYYTHDPLLPHLRKELDGLDSIELDLILKYSELKKLIIGTQSFLNKEKILEQNPRANVKVLPIFIEKHLREVSTNESKEGVLIVGGGKVKQMELAIKSIHEAGLKAIIISNSLFKKKIEALIEGTEAKAYYDVSGDEKIELFKKAKVLLSTSKVETFGINVVEGLHHCNVVLLQTNPWVDVFKYECMLTDKKNLVDTLKKAHSLKFDPIALQENAKIYTDNALEIWNEFLTPQEPKEIRKSKLLDFISLRDFINFEYYITQFLGRSKVAAIDLNTVYSNKDNIKRLDFNDCTVIGPIDCNFSLVEDEW